MAQQLLLEGKDPQELLQRAHSEYGPHVSIVHAEKVRSGGMLGFFMRESYVLTVEVPEQPQSDTSQVGGGRATSAITGKDAQPGTQPGAQPGVQPSTQSGAGADAHVDAAMAAELADVAQARREFLSASGQPAPAQAAPSQPAQPVAAPPGQSQPAAADPAASFDRQMDALLERDDAPATTRAFSPVQFPSLETNHGEIVRSPSVAGHRDADLGQGAAVVRDGGPALHEIWPTAAIGQPAVVRGEAMVRGETVVRGETTIHREATVAGPGNPTVAELLRLGVPAHMLPDFARAQQTVAVHEIAARLASSRVRRPQPGDLLVLAGAPDQALRAATQVAFWAHVPATDVILAGEGPAVTGHGRRVLSATAAAKVRERKAAARAEGRPVIVALGITPGREGNDASAALLAALGADLTWAVVDAGLSDAARQAALEGVVGGAGDVGIAVMGLAHAQAPAAVVDAPWPVAWMDGLPASATVWAAVLEERSVGAESTRGPWSQ